MAQLPLKPCASPGCRALVRGAPRCPTHTRSEARGTNKEQGYDNTWRRLRDLFIASNPQCKCGRPAEIVHHVRPVNQAPALRLDESNLRAMCRRCHGQEHGKMGTWSVGH